MSYIDRNLLPNEQILLRTRKHKIIFLYPAVLLLFSIIATNYMQHDIILTRIIWAPWLITAIFWAQVGLDYITSEFAITNQRIMMREGFFLRHTNEMRINAVSQVAVDQSLIGSWLNYGNVAIYAFGGIDRFATLDQPIVFQRKVNEQIAKASPH